MENDNFIPLSYISQIGYCQRRAALLMNEQQWLESTDTAKGRNEHKIVHNGKIENRKILHTVTDLAVCSDKLGLFGFCDLIEFVEDDNGTTFPFTKNKIAIIYPIEYKHGKLRNEEEYELQLCAQAMCIEEMYNCTIKEGAVFYITSHRRKNVILTNDLREKVIKFSNELHDLRNNPVMPIAKKSAKCLKCSMKDICIPDLPRNNSNYIKNIIKFLEEDHYEKT